MTELNAQLCNRSFERQNETRSSLAFAASHHPCQLPIPLLYFTSSPRFLFSAVSLHSTVAECGARFLLHTLQLCPSQSFKNVQFERYLTVTENGDSMPQTFPVVVSTRRRRMQSHDQFPSRCMPLIVVNRVLCTRVTTACRMSVKSLDVILRRSVLKIIIFLQYFVDQHTLLHFLSSYIS